MYKFDLHVHTKHSRDCMTEPSAVVETAKEKDIDFVAITDHDAIAGWKEVDSKRVIPGIEVTSKGGEILGLFIKEEIPKKLTAEATIKKIHEQGGIAIAPHPFDPVRPGLGRKAFKLDLDGIEIYNSKSGFWNFSNRYFCRKLDIPKIAVSDAHFASTIGKGLTASKHKPKKAILENEVKILRKDATSIGKNLKNFYIRLFKRK